MAQPLSIEALRRLAGLLSQNDVTVMGLAEDLGERSVDLQGNILVQEPSLRGVRRASVVREVRALDRPALMTLELATALSMGDLESAFGPPKLVAAEHPGQPRSAVFFINGAGQFDVRLIAVVAADGTTGSITLTREQKLAT
jgi:hypothetical protein